MRQFRKAVVAAVLMGAVVGAQAQTPNLSDVIQRVESVLQDLKALNVPPPPPPPPPWSSNAPDVLSIDYLSFSSVMDARFIDGNAGWDGTGRAIHYGDMSGPLPPTPPPGQVADWSGKFSNATYLPSFGTDSIANLRYLQNGTDGSKEPQPKYPGTCATCRIKLWQFRWLTPRPEYFFRVALWVDPQTLTNQTDLGIKLMGMGNLAQNVSQILELGRKTSTGWPLQLYRYDGEGAQTVDPMPNAPEIKPGRWWVLEGHYRSNTVAAGTWQKDGLIEVKVNGKLVYSRSDVKTFDATRPGPFTAFYSQLYHGGTLNASGLLVFREAALALSAKQWVGPPPSMNLNVLQ